MVTTRGEEASTKRTSRARGRGSAKAQPKSHAKGKQAKPVPGHIERSKEYRDLNELMDVENENENQMNVSNTKAAVSPKGKGKGKDDIKPSKAGTPGKLKRTDGDEFYEPDPRDDVKGIEGHEEEIDPNNLLHRDKRLKILEKEKEEMVDPPATAGAEALGPSTATAIGAGALLNESTSLASPSLNAPSSPPPSLSSTAVPESKVTPAQREFAETGEIHEHMDVDHDQQDHGNNKGMFAKLKEGAANMLDHLKAGITGSEPPESKEDFGNNVQIKKNEEDIAEAVKNPTLSASSNTDGSNASNNVSNVSFETNIRDFNQQGAEIDDKEKSGSGMWAEIKDTATNTWDMCKTAVGLGPNDKKEAQDMCDARDANVGGKEGSELGGTRAASPTPINSVTETRWTLPPGSEIETMGTAEV